MRHYDLIALLKMKKVYIFVVQMFRYTISSVKTEIKNSMRFENEEHSKQKEVQCKEKQSGSFNV